MIGPVVLAKEGVLCGSNGCIFWAGHILEKNTDKWDGAPVSLDHPVVDGAYVSINHNAETRSSIIGVVKNPKFDPSIRGIRAQIEIPANHPQASHIQNIREVSMGVFSDEVYGPGEWQGQEYSVCSITLEADHLALLPGPGARGACSFKSGCGIRTNEAKRLISQALTTYFNSLKGEKTMNANEVAPLLPPGVKEPKSEPGKSDWTGPGVEPLLPAEFNRKPESKRDSWTGNDGDVQPLMPIIHH